MATVAAAASLHVEAPRWPSGASWRTAAAANPRAEAPRQPFGASGRQRRRRAHVWRRQCGRPGRAGGRRAVGEDEVEVRWLPEGSDVGSGKPAGGDGELDHLRCPSALDAAAVEPKHVW